MAERVLLLPESMSAGSVYQLLTNAVVPRPIALVSTVSEAGVANLAPFSFFMVGGANPPSLVFCPVRAGGGLKKDTLRNIEETGEYVINLVDRAMAEAMNQTAAPVSSEVSEWERTPFASSTSIKVRPHGVMESPLSFEMKLFEVVHHGEAPSSASYVIGEAVAMHIRADLWDGESAVPFELISRLGGSAYFDMSDNSYFELERPKS